jgi:hypothetical protein
MEKGTVRSSAHHEWEGRLSSGEYLYAFSSGGCTSLSLGNSPEEARAGVLRHQILVQSALSADDIVRQVLEEFADTIVSVDPPSSKLLAS